jgi:hypothetical protein
VATTDPATLPEKATWYLATNLPHPDAPHATTGAHPSADLDDFVRIYGLWPWIVDDHVIPQGLTWSGPLGSVLW